MSRLVLRNVKTVTEDVFDLTIAEGAITSLDKPGSGVGEHVIDFKESVYMSSGWIDMHVHAFKEFSPYGDDIDEIGYKLGATTIVDAGSTGADRIDDLVAAGRQAKTNLLAFCNISRIGLERIDELTDKAWLDESVLVQKVQDHQDTIVGLKARISRSVVGEQGIKPLDVARRFSEKTQLPLMVHIGSGPPDIREVLERLQSRDIITHYLNGKANNLFDDSGQPLPAFLAAIDRGVHLDVGHGNASFSFDVADQAKLAGIPFHTISTDIYRKNRLEGPVYSLASVLSKFIALGYSLTEVIAAVTTSAATWLGRPELGRIEAGDAANLTLFSLEDKPLTLVDSEGAERLTQQQINVKGVVVNGEYVEL
ncbi:amidohydrolase/deacetylase family metallohydrolase [Aureibacillus halotolerans]|uniref:Dihydroorotase n=1 Tax=Aureibacillus halotolerans TaxID=1508390 RepID=A0A4R6U300_9BACI|nr:amidohydrolase/deacetylase family metallohydrolase [Aureibacillus halotolerans]TDQ40818.1 dihydroorotase [Aureibacillus halotolerans]